MNKPHCLELEEATNELTQTIERIAREHNLPCYLLEPIVSELLARLQNGKRVEIEEARKSYEAQTEE